MSDPDEAHVMKRVPVAESSAPGWSPQSLSAFIGQVQAVRRLHLSLPFRKNEGNRCPTFSSLGLWALASGPLPMHWPARSVHPPSLRRVHRYKTVATLWASSRA